MRQAITIIMLVGSISGCASTNYETALKQLSKDTQACQNSPITKTDKLSETSVVSMSYSIARGCTPVEKGTYQNINYIIEYDTGLAKFDSTEKDQSTWEVSCKNDQVTDLKSATVKRGNFFLFRTKDRDFSSVIGEKYPGSDEIVRVDSFPPETVSKGAKPLMTASEKIVAQMKSGKTFLTRYTVWPSGINHDETHEAKGFKQAYDYAERCIK